VFLNIRNVLLVGLSCVVLVAVATSAGADGITIGLLLNTERAFDGYTLFTPIAE